MPQTVFDVGDPITSRLTLGLTPDGTTSVTVTVRRPDGTAITGLTTSGWLGAGGDEKTVQWFATDDGTVGGTTLAAAGDWLAVWKIIGTGANTLAKVYSVRPLPGTSTYAAYLPFLSEVGDYVPWLTLDTTAPGADTFLGTFTGATWPSDEQVHRVTMNVARPITARWPALSSTLYDLARSYIALRTAAQLARAFPRSENDLTLADRLASEADSLWSTLTELSDNATANDPTAVAQAPVWAFPEPVSWGDDYP